GESLGLKESPGFSNVPSASESLRKRIAIIPSEETEKHWSDRLVKKEPEIRIKAIERLGRFGTQTALGHVLGREKDTSPQVRLKLISVLSASPCPEALGALNRMTKDSDPAVAQAAREALNLNQVLLQGGELQASVAIETDKQSKAMELSVQRKEPMMVPATQSDDKRRHGDIKIVNQNDEKQSRAPTRSWKPPKRNCSRRTKSSPRSTKSSRTKTWSSARPTTT
ncbi:MAG: HEAT repeat domain-containing protein, partial [Elusimicrobiota bacterium]